MSRFRPSAALAAALALSSCDGYRIEPRIPELEHELNEKAIAANPDLDADETAKDQLKAALEMLFGTPANPGYLVLEEWIDEEFDPNRYDSGLGDEEFAALTEGNQETYAQQLAAIDAGDFAAVREPLFAVDLWKSWQELAAAMPADPDSPYGDEADWTWRQEARALFTDWYPSLRESAEMYRQQCMHCHGVSGGGNGSTAEFLNPRPRDYRQGKFKFTALKGKARPRRADLLRTLREGIYTTAMPSFRRFSDAHLNGLADYVELLAKRGETELLLIDEYEPGFGIPMEKVIENHRFVLERWEGTEEQLIVYEGEVPPATPERIAHGRELFLGAEGQGANCASCHGVDGRGGGLSAKELDPVTQKMVPVKDDWGNPISPRDFTGGLFRFGRRPIDLYRRVYAGINGTPMPEHIGMQITEADGTKRPLSEDDLWDLVHFVRSLSAHEHVASAAGSAQGHDDHDAGSGH